MESNNLNQASQNQTQPQLNQTPDGQYDFHDRVLEFYLKSHMIEGIEEKENIFEGYTENYIKVR